MVKSSTRNRRLKARRLLAKAFASRGYVRRPNPVRLREGHASYKKGVEVRIVADTPTELNRLRRAVRAVGFEPGRPFRKHSALVLPVYGEAAAEWFERLGDASS